ncbi:Rossmann-like and DUF2520 domain-containing protein [Halocola ammonii]
MIKSVALVGAGNVASQLCRILKEKQVDVVGVYSLHPESRKKFGEQWQVPALDSPSEVNDSEADLVIFAVNDNSVEAASAAISSDIPAVHTSGSVPLAALSQKTRGVFYPLQTFSKEKTVDWKKVPLCIEGSDDAFEEKLLELAHRISETVNKVDSEQRKFLHLSAVFACNFSNHMYAIANELMQEHNMDFEMLKPLILETAEKIGSLNPREAQTGPAQRKDEKTMNAHLELLAGSDNLRHLYGLISEQIIALQNGKKL